MERSVGAIWIVGCRRAKGVADAGTPGKRRVRSTVLLLVPHGLSILMPVFTASLTPAVLPP